MTQQTCPSVRQYRLFYTPFESGIGCRHVLKKSIAFQAFLGEAGTMDQSQEKDAAEEFWQLTFIVMR